MTTPELERALAALADPTAPPELAANVMARIARLEDEAPRPVDAAPESRLRWMPVLPGALLVVGAYLYGLVQEQAAGSVVPGAPVGAHLWGLPFDPLPVVIATGLLLCLGPLLPRAGDRALP